MGFFKQLTLLALTIGLGLNLAGCQPSDSKAKKQPSLTSISVSPASATVMLSSTQALRVIATFSNNSTLDVTSASSFSVTSSSPAGVVLVSSAGVVTAAKAGTATITATYSALGITQTAAATVTVPSATLVSIAVTPTAPTVAPGATQPLTVTGTYNEGSRAVIATGLTFVSSDTSVATVGAAGVVAGVAEGTATITTTESNSGRSTTTLVTVSLSGGGGGCGTTEPTCAPATVIPADNVMIYSDAESIAGFDSCPNWGQATICHGEVTIAGNKSLWYSALNYQGLDWSSNPVNVSSRAKLHIDFWTPDLESVKVSIIGGGKENAVTQVLTTGSWNSVDIDLSEYTVPDLSVIAQIKLESAVPGTLYVDNIYFWGTAGGGGGGGTVIVSFDEIPPPKLTDFGVNGAPPVIANDPAGGANQVLKVFKYASPPPGSEQWAGVTVSTQTVPLDSIPAIPFTATDTKMTVRAYSPAVGVRVRLKVEDASNPGISCETDAITTTGGAWETLTFDFANPGLSPPVGGGPTSPLDPSKTYNKVSIFSDFGIGNGGSAPLPEDRVYYYDDITFLGGGGGGGGGGTAPTDAPATVIPAGSVTIYSDAATIANFDPFPNWGQSPPVTFSEPTIAANKLLQYGWAGPGGLYQGLDWSANPVNVSAKGKLHIDFWSPDITSVKVSIIGGGQENAVTQVLTTGSWNSVDIDLSAYTAPDLSAIIQIKLEPATAGTLYVDNIYFWGTAAGASCGTTEPTCAPTTAIPAGSVTIYSDAATIANFDPFPNWGQSPPVTFSEPTIAANKSLQYGWAGPGGLYQGLDWNANPVDVSTKGTLHIDFWTPDLASVKVSIISAGKENAVTQALTTGSWNSIDIDLSNYPVPDKTAIIQIKLEPATAGTLYVDNIYFWGTAGGGGGGGACTEMGCAGPVAIPVATTNDVFGFIKVGDGIFAQDYIGALEGNGNHGGWTGAATIGAASGGEIGYYNDPLMSSSGQKIDEGGWVAGTIDNAGGVPSFFRYFVFTAPGSTFAASYMGLYANSPTNGTVDVSGYASIKFKLWGPAEMYEKPGFDPVIEITLAGPAVAGCAATGSRGTEISTTFTANQKIGAGSSYKLALAGWTVKGVCGTDTAGTAVAAVLSHLARVAVTVPGSSFNFTNASAPGQYPTGVNLGPVAFTNN